MRKPGISFIIPTFNSSKTLEETLSSIRFQNYRQDKIEIILADGGSKDKTFEIAKKYSAKILKITSKKQGAEYNRAVGIHQAANKYLVLLDHDNVLPHSEWLNKMLQPIIENNDVVGVETMYYTYLQKDTLFGRYFSLLGANDPLPFYLGKADRLAHFYTKPQQYGTYKKAKVKERKDYFLVEFDKNFIPTLGSNGFLVNKETILKNAKSDLDHFFHIDVNVDVIKKGFTKYAFIKDSVTHHTNERGVIDYFKRRSLFMKKYGIEDLSKRRYSVFEKNDLLNLIFFIFIALTIIKPLYDSIRGYKKIPDFAWFIHPIISFGTVFVYGYTLLSAKIAK